MKRIKQFERTDRDNTNDLLLMLYKNSFEKINLSQIIVLYLLISSSFLVFICLNRLNNCAFYTINPTVRQYHMPHLSDSISYLFPRLMLSLLHFLPAHHP